MGVSSISGGRISSGNTPSCASSSLRRGLPDPRISRKLLKAIVDPTFCQIIGCHFNLHFITGQNTNAVLAHFACRVRDNFMAVFQLDPKRRIRQEFLNDTGKFERIFLGHAVSIACGTALRQNKCLNDGFLNIIQGNIDRNHLYLSPRAVQAGNVAVFLADDLPRVRGALSDVMARGKRPQGIGIACDGPHRWVNSEII
jgi:hypothetical protein